MYQSYNLEMSNHSVKGFTIINIALVPPRSIKGHCMQYLSPHKTLLRTRSYVVLCVLYLIAPHSFSYFISTEILYLHYLHPRSGRLLYKLSNNHHILSHLGPDTPRGDDIQSDDVSRARSVINGETRCVLVDLCDPALKPHHGADDPAAQLPYTEAGYRAIIMTAGGGA